MLDLICRAGSKGQIQNENNGSIEIRFRNLSQRKLVL